MGKRSDFERRDKDKYLTPRPPVDILMPFLPDAFTYIEPCAADGGLVRHIASLAPQSHCALALDIEPEHPSVRRGDALELHPTDFATDVDYVITNPPWTRTKASGYLLHHMIEVFSQIAPTWLLFDSDWMHTAQAKPYIEKYLEAFVSIGRVKWIEGSTMTGKDNCCWYLFDKDARTKYDVPVFYGRGIVPAM